MRDHSISRQRWPASRCAKAILLGMLACTAPGAGLAGGPPPDEDAASKVEGKARPGDIKQAATAKAMGTANATGTVKTAGIVLKWVRGDKEANYRRALPLIREAAKNGAKIVCTTECFLDGYAIADKTIPPDAYRALGEPIPTGKYYRKLAALARELKIN